MENNDKFNKPQLSPYTMADFGVGARTKGLSKGDLNVVLKKMNAKSVIVIGVGNTLPHASKTIGEFTVSTIGVEQDMIIGALDFVSEISKPDTKN